MKWTIISIMFAGALVAGAVLYSGEGSFGVEINNKIPEQKNNVSIVDGKQIIEIDAKGGYLPRSTMAKANIPTVIKMNTRGTYDCTAGLNIPSLGYSQHLPPSGETLIEVPPQEASSTLRGLCTMGMYNFSVEFN